MAVKCPNCQSDNPETSRFCSDCGTQLIPSEEISVPTETLEIPKEELTTGFTFAGRYQIIEELGKGGMGRVYKVLDEKVKEKIALKLLKPDIASDKKTIERFSNELKLARKIRHKNVCQMYDLNEEKGTHFITMEYVPGEDLKSSIRRFGQLPVVKSISIVVQIGEGLAEAHRLGVVHRDLKPQNIMIDKEGNARIMDFGIARSLKEKGITGAGVMIGTPEYMSPEQVEGKQADQRSDIYSLGVILYEMVTGSVPFEGDTPLSIAMKHKTEAPLNPQEINPQIPDALREAILKCMEKEREKRYQTAEDMLHDLHKIKARLSTAERIFPSKEAGEEIKWKNSIAVLPFADLSPQRDQEYFCDGLAEELINALTRMNELRVVARTSAFAFKGKDMDIREIGKKLNVDKVLEGSVRKAENKLRISAQLINVADGYHLWSERYDRYLEDVFAIQDEISTAVSEELKVKLLGEKKKRLVKRPTEDMEAYNLYLKGISLRSKVHPGELGEGIECFQKAIERDPNFALAYVGMGSIYGRFAFLGLSSPDEVYPKAKDALGKALKLDDSLGEAHALLGNIYAMYGWDWPAAEEAFKKAIALNPGLDSGHAGYASYLLIRRRFDESIIEMRLARELNPLNPVPHAELIFCYYCAGRFEEAEEQVQIAKRVDPNYPLTYFYASFIDQTKGDYQEMIESLQKAYTLSGGTLPWAECGLGVAYTLAGKKDKADEVLNKLLKGKEGGYVPCFSIANNYLFRGNMDKALEWMEKAYEQHDFLTPYLNAVPGWEVFRSHPRGKAVLKKIKLE